jgi:undecaprenyl-diphosphatase
MNLWQALFLGALQGVSELFPVSSLAQTILLPALLRWDMSQRENPDFLAFVVALHLATAIALFIYFWRDWKVVIEAFIGSAKRGKLVYDDQSKFAWLLVAGTIIVGVVGLAFEKRLRMLFEQPKYVRVVAAVLMVNGVMMLLADVLKRRISKAEDPGNAHGPHTADPSTDVPTQRKAAHEMTFIEGAAVGATQTLALIPGVSRSGVTIVAGLLAGLSYKEASRFSFMLATPVIGLAALLKVPKLLRHDARHLLALTIPSAVLAGITAYLSTYFLMRYFQHHRLGPFGWYCIVFGALSLVMLGH